MKLLKAGLSAVVSLFTGLLILVAAETPPSNFSAEMVMRAQNQVMQGKIYASNQKTRMENPVNVIIARPDLNVSWVLMPQQKMYMEQPLDPANLPKTSVQMPGEIERIEVGTESIDGRQARKFKVTYSDNGRQDSLYQWMAEGIPIPVKMESMDGSWSMEYRNIHVGPQPDVIFEVPPGYQKMAMPNLNDMMAQAMQENY